MISGCLIGLARIGNDRTVEPLLEMLTDEQGNNGFGVLNIL